MSDRLPTPDPESLLIRLQDLDHAARSGEQFLRMYLASDTSVLLPLQQLTEVLSIPIAQIVPIPHMPAWVIGAYNWRGDILWMVDLGHLCGLTPWYAQTTRNPQHSAVVLRIPSDRQMQESRTTPNAKAQLLGLVVNRIAEVEWCEPEQIQPLPFTTMPSAFDPFLRGYWWKSNDDILAVLDGKAIIDAMPTL